MGSRKKRKERRDAKTMARRAMVAPRVVGLYPVADRPGVCLVELLTPAPGTRLDLARLGQPDPDRPARVGEAAWDLRLLDPRGTRAIAEEADLEESDEVWDEDLRLAFFLHGVDPAAPLLTPWGPLPLPAPQARPGRLAWLAYEARL